MGAASNPGLGTAHASSRSAVLDVIRAAGTISRVELIRATGLTGATISTVVRRLINEGLVVEVGHGESTGGKPRVLLQLDPRSRFAVGVSLDHAGIAYVVADLGGSVVVSGTLPGAGSEEPDQVVARIAKEIDAALHAAGVQRELVLGIGAVSPGPISTPVGMTFVPPFMRPWAGFPLRESLQEATGLPALLENDATAAAIGEYWVGGVDADAAFGVIFMGTGLGAGVLVNGTVYRGASSNAGEIGHICVDIDGPQCWCGSRGCIEAVAGPSAVVGEAQALGITLLGTSVTERFAELTGAALRGEQPALGLLERSARFLGVAAQSLANVMDLGHVVLTGPAFAAAGPLYLPAVERQLETSFFARGSHPVRATISGNATSAAAIGGAALVLHTELAPRRTGTAVQLTTTR